MKAQLDANAGYKRGIRTTKPSADSKLFSVDADAKWRGRLDDAIDFIRSTE